MRILLLGEYSNVHATLARGLCELGHEAVVASNGDFWKDYPRDIDFARPSGRLGGVSLALTIFRNLHNLSGFDVVQLINPIFVELKASRNCHLYQWLRRHNRHIVLGAFGMDYYWVSQCRKLKPLRYSDFNIGSELRTDAVAMREVSDWVGTTKQRLNETIAADCDGIVTGLYEYDVCYRPLFPQKTRFIPFPIVVDHDFHPDYHKPGSPVRLFIGISKERTHYKGTDIMLKAAEAVRQKYPNRVELRVVNGVPFAEYRRLMIGSDAILDQLYSYTPSMNPLEAMAHGIVCIGGGEPESYNILHEDELRPIINVEPNYESVFRALENLVLNDDKLPQLQRESIEYVNRHHDYLKVARQYESFYQWLGK